jgi:hypothetical protein
MARSDLATHAGTPESAVTVRASYRRQHDLRLPWWGAGSGAKRMFYGVRWLSIAGRRPASDVQCATG